MRGNPGILNVARKKCPKGGKKKKLPGNFESVTEYSLELTELPLTQTAVRAASLAN